MSLVALLKNPHTAVPELVRENDSLTIPAVAFACVSFAEGADRMAAQFPGRNPLVVLLFAAVAAVAIGSWSWAILYGGFIHLGARVFRGREGWGDTSRAVGYALFWPGLLGASAAGAAFIVDRIVSGGGATLLIVLLVQVIAGFWGLYATIAAVRAWHSFGWWRSIGSYLAGILMFSLPVVALVLLLQ